MKGGPKLSLTPFLHRALQFAIKNNISTIIINIVKIFFAIRN